MAGPLEGVLVMDLTTSLSGPLAASMLADAGARVVKLDRIGGELSSEWDSAVYGLSSAYVWNARNKENVALNLKDPRGLRAARELARRADVIIENFSPGTVARLGMGYEEIARENPRVVYCHISGYGQTGPYRDEKAFDFLIQGESGVVSMTGTAEEMCKVPLSIVDLSAGMYANQAILLALIQRQSTGRGQEIDISMLQCIVGWLGPPAFYYWFRKEIPQRHGARHLMLMPYGPYRCADDRYVNVAVLSQSGWRAFCQRVIDRQDLVDDPRFVDNETRIRNRAELEPLLAAEFAKHDQARWLERLHQAGIPCGRVNGIAETLAHPQLQARGAIVEIPSARGPIPAVANPIVLSEGTMRHDYVPLSGEHTRAILAELGFDGETIEQMINDGAAAQAEELVERR